MSADFKNQHILILGLGLTGLSAVQWLTARGATLRAADTRAHPPALDQVLEQFKQLPVYLGSFEPGLLQDIDGIVMSPGVSLERNEFFREILKRKIPIWGDMELFARAKPSTSKVIAVTGTNGKSTVVTLVGELCKSIGLKTCVAGNIGLPILEALEQPVPEVYVLELSSFQLEYAPSFRADAATVLNVTEDHLDRYANIHEYAAVKANIYRNCPVAVKNREDALTADMGKGCARTLTFGLGAPQNDHEFGIMMVEGQPWLASEQHAWMPCRELQLAGTHNVVNALAALALCQGIGLPIEPLLPALACFSGLPHRVEKVAEIAGVSFYDDSKGTNVGATCAAMQGMSGKVVLIAGGDGKGQDFSPLTPVVEQKARAVILIGRDGPRLYAQLKTAQVPLLMVKTLPEAVQQSFEQAEAGDVVLLSPACASMDMFQDYKHRAMVFVEAVRGLEQRYAGLHP